MGMINSIRAVRKAKRLTLEEVAARCKPPTTAQTIGRLETGTRTLSLDWMNRIAAALGVEAKDLVRLPQEADLMITALINADGAQAPTKAQPVPPLRAEPGALALRFSGSIGEYRTGDLVLCRRLNPAALPQVLNRDILVPRPAGRFIFGRLLAVDGERMQILPLAASQRQQIVALPTWAAVAERLIRDFGE
jgi:transcriptional regulator with XRE-family HTH domain